MKGTHCHGWLEGISDLACTALVHVRMVRHDRPDNGLPGDHDITCRGTLVLKVCDRKASSIVLWIKYFNTGFMSQIAVRHLFARPAAPTV